MLSTKFLLWWCLLPSLSPISLLSLKIGLEPIQEETTVPAPAIVSEKEDFSMEDAISRAAREHQVDPLLIRSVIAAESGFDPQAESPTGAVGLMQVMPTRRGNSVTTRKTKRKTS